MWEVRLSKRALKQARKFPPEVWQSLATLMKGLQIQGPVAGNWPNYGKLSPTRHHCHIKKGKPTYVAVWEVRDQKIHVIEVIYVGTHEKAPY
ncbi:MAG: cytotoxic translational repressor of toxin-antitoxin stability system [Desulfovermiculus sp.]|nr:cytotoxic translational repressor of toxin-antitoxin stability system [Desulfovermiculus sp.]